jgi:ribose 5-phosphate isomerase A
MAGRSLSFITFDAAEISNLEAKRQVASRVADRAADGDVIGVGSGSTSYLTLLELGQRHADGQLRDISVVSTSHEVTLTAARLELTVVDILTRRPDWLFDGADEVDPAGRLIKGRGGALLRERRLFDACPERIVAVDPSKHVTRLGSRFPVPVEVMPPAVLDAATRLYELGATDVIVRRGTGKDGPVITEAGNLLLDCAFAQIPDGHSAAIGAVPGVVGSGLFEGYDYALVSVE